MNLFTPLYQLIEDLFGMYDQDFDFIFTAIYEGGSYDLMGLMFVFIPAILVVLFYYLYRNPYATSFHWTLALLIGAVVVFLLTYNIMRLNLADYIVDPDPLVQDFVNSLIVQYCLLNAVLSLITGFIWSMLIKQKSKIQMHLPF
jgi:hypothetical protein